MRYVIARRLGFRGEGLGNEMLPWAKGFIASQVLNAQLVGPSWGLNRRRYYRNFGTNRLDFLWEDCLRRLPSYYFSEQEYWDSGEIDFGKAILNWAREKGIVGKRAFIVVVDGMYGSYPAIRNARPFLLSKLLTSRGALEHVYCVSSALDRDKLFVAVHMRVGEDFPLALSGESLRGQFNIRISANWYRAVCKALLDRFGGRVQFYFFTDRRDEAYDEIVETFNPGQVRHTGLTECGDLLLMSQADLRVCSISSYSLMASFLSGGPFIWFEPQLTLEDGGYTLWGAEEQQRRTGSPTKKSIEFTKNLLPGMPWAAEFQGYAVKEDGVLPAGLVTTLERKLCSNERSASLLDYGCLPGWACLPENAAPVFSPLRELTRE